MKPWHIRFSCQGATNKKISSAVSGITAQTQCLQPVNNIWQLSNVKYYLQKWNFVYLVSCNCPYVIMVTPIFSCSNQTFLQSFFSLFSAQSTVSPSSPPVADPSPGPCPARVSSPCGVGRRLPGASSLSGPGRTRTGGGRRRRLSRRSWSWRWKGRRKSQKVDLRWWPGKTTFLLTGTTSQYHIFISTLANYTYSSF